MEFERDPIHTVSLTGRLWTVVEHMSKVTTALAAMDLGSRHEEAAIGFGLDRSIKWRPEARPTGSTVEFGIG